MRLCLNCGKVIPDKINQFAVCDCGHTELYEAGQRYIAVHDGRYTYMHPSDTSSTLVGTDVTERCLRKYHPPVETAFNVIQEIAYKEDRYGEYIRSLPAWASLLHHHIVQTMPHDFCKHYVALLDYHCFKTARSWLTRNNASYELEQNTGVKCCPAFDDKKHEAHGYNAIYRTVENMPLGEDGYVCALEAMLNGSSAGEAQLFAEGGLNLFQTKEIQNSILGTLQCLNRNTNAGRRLEEMEAAAHEIAVNYVRELYSQEALYSEEIVEKIYSYCSMASDIIKLNPENTRASQLFGNSISSTYSLMAIVQRICRKMHEHAVYHMEKTWDTIICKEPGERFNGYFLVPSEKSDAMLYRGAVPEDDRITAHPMSIIDEGGNVKAVLYTGERNMYLGGSQEDSVVIAANQYINSGIRGKSNGTHRHQQN